MRQDSAFSISNCNAPGCSNPYSHLSVSSIRPPSIHLRYRNTPSSTPQRNSPSAHCPNNSPYATCFEPWNASQAIPYTPPYGTAHLGRNAASFLYQSDGARLFRAFPSPFRCRLCGSWRTRRTCASHMPLDFLRIDAIVFISEPLQIALQIRCNYRHKQRKTETKSIKKR